MKNKKSSNVKRTKTQLLDFYRFVGVMRSWFWMFKFGSNPVFAKANRFAISIDTVYVTIFVLATATQASHAPITIRDMATGSIFHKTMIFFPDIFPFACSAIDHSHGNYSQSKKHPICTIHFWKKTSGNAVLFFRIMFSWC